MLPLLLAAAVGHFDLWTPVNLYGNWPDVPADFAPVRARRSRITLHATLTRN